MTQKTFSQKVSQKASSQHISEINDNNKNLSDTKSTEHD
jgi:hypothetical protein